MEGNKIKRILCNISLSVDSVLATGFFHVVYRERVTITLAEIVRVEIARYTMKDAIVRMAFHKMLLHVIKRPKFGATQTALVLLLPGVLIHVTLEQFVVIKLEVTLWAGDILLPGLDFLLMRPDVSPKVGSVVNSFPADVALVMQVFLVSLDVRGSPFVVDRLKRAQSAAKQFALVLMHGDFVFLETVAIVGAIIAILAREAPLAGVFELMDFER